MGTLACLLVSAPGLKHQTERRAHSTAGSSEGFVRGVLIGCSATVCVDFYGDVGRVFFSSRNSYNTTQKSTVSVRKVEQYPVSCTCACETTLRVIHSCRQHSAGDLDVIICDGF